MESSSTKATRLAKQRGTFTRRTAKTGSAPLCTAEMSGVLVSLEKEEAETIRTNTVRNLATLPVKEAGEIEKRGKVATRTST